MVALGPDTVTWTIFARGSPISLNLEISTGLGGEFWDEKGVGILGAWNPRLLDSSVGKSQDQATNKQTAVLMEAPAVDARPPTQVEMVSATLLRASEEIFICVSQFCS